jgi:hypothetical protein
MNSFRRQEKGKFAGFYLKKIKGRGFANGTTIFSYLNMLLTAVRTIFSY